MSIYFCDLSHFRNSANNARNFDNMAEAKKREKTKKNQARINHKRQDDTRDTTDDALNKQPGLSSDTDTAEDNSQKDAEHSNM